MKSALAIMAAVFPLSVFAHAGAHPPGTRHDPDTGEHVKSTGEREETEGGSWRDKLVFRGSASLDLNQSINLGGENADSPAVIGSVEPGVGYMLTEKLSLDLDAETHFQVSPSFLIRDLGLTPGARFYPISQVYLRAGAPILFLPQFGAGVLGGAGYLQPLGGKASLVVGLDYTYYFTEYYRRTAPQGRLDVHAGVQTRF